MKGIRIDNNYDVVTNGISAFAVYFQPISKELEKVYWYYPSQPFSYKKDESGELEQALSNLPNKDGYITPNSLLPKFAWFVSDDWNELLGFYSQPDVSFVSAQIASADGQYNIEFFDKHVDLCFFSVDGAFWQFCAKEHALLQRVFNHVSSLAGIKAEWVELSDFW